MTTLITPAKGRHTTWSAELDDMRSIMSDAAAAIAVDRTYVDADMRRTVEMFTQAQTSQTRASVLVLLGRGGSAHRK